MKTDDNNFDFSKISFNAGLLVKDMQGRGIKVKYIKDTQLIHAKYKSHKEILYDIHSSLLNYPLGWIINDKYYSKRWLDDRGINVAPGFFFRIDQEQEIIDYANKTGYPVVMKPTAGSHGDNVYTNIDNEAELREKLTAFKEKGAENGYLIVEKHVEGNEYRLFITKNNFFAAVVRIPASITGDGFNNVLKLIQIENHRRMNPRDTCLCEIRLDYITFDFMEKHNITIDYVPKKGEKVVLRGNSNVSTGGNCYEVTDTVHPTVIDLAKKIMGSFPDLPYLGIDLLCEDITKKIDKNNYFVCELNSAPGLSLHMMPEKGKPKNVAGALVDLLFPETYDLIFQTPSPLRRGSGLRL